MNLQYKELMEKDLHLNLLERFDRYQQTERVVFKNSDGYDIKADRFVDEWDDQRKDHVLHELLNCIHTGGVVFAAFSQSFLVGFANIESERFGSKNQYIELPYIHVSKEYRGFGIGKKLFEMCCRRAKGMGAEKLYIGAHPAVETQQFYQSLGCTYAEEINPSIYNREPLDIQLEYVLFGSKDME